MRMHTFGFFFSPSFRLSIHASLWVHFKWKKKENNVDLLVSLVVVSMCNVHRTICFCSLAIDFCLHDIVYVSKYITLIQYSPVEMGFFCETVFFSRIMLIFLSSSLFLSILNISNNLSSSKWRRRAASTDSKTFFGFGICVIQFLRKLLIKMKVRNGFLLD